MYCVEVVLDKLFRGGVHLQCNMGECIHVCCTRPAWAIPGAPKCLLHVVPSIGARPDSGNGQESDRCVFFPVRYVQESPVTPTPPPTPWKKEEEEKRKRLMQVRGCVGSLVRSAVLDQTIVYGFPSLFADTSSSFLPTVHSGP